MGGGGVTKTGNTAAYFPKGFIKFFLFHFLKTYIPMNPKQSSKLQKCDKWQSCTFKLSGWKTAQFAVNSAKVATLIHFEDPYAKIISSYSFRDNCMRSFSKSLETVCLQFVLFEIILFTIFWVWRGVDRVNHAEIQHTERQDFKLVVFWGPCIRVVA